MKSPGLSGLNVAVMYIGAIMGAGFASGRETWQFFGVFGGYGRAGILIFAAIFMAVGFMVSYNASRLGTHDMGSVIVPGNSKRLKRPDRLFYGNHPGRSHGSYVGRCGSPDASVFRS